VQPSKALAQKLVASFRAAVRAAYSSAAALLPRLPPSSRHHAHDIAIWLFFSFHAHAQRFVRCFAAFSCLSPCPPSQPRVLGQRLRSACAHFALAHTPSTSTDLRIWRTHSCDRRPPFSFTHSLAYVIPSPNDRDPLHLFQYFDVASHLHPLIRFPFPSFSCNVTILSCISRPHPTLPSPLSRIHIPWYNSPSLVIICCINLFPSYLVSFANIFSVSGVLKFRMGRGAENLWLLNRTTLSTGCIRVRMR
jgi:hypothetical protein